MPTEKKRKIVAFVGSADSSRDQAPWKDNSVEIWGLAWRNHKRCEKYFDIHPIGPMRKSVPKDYVEYLSTLTKPVYLQKPHPDIPNSLAYPLNDVIKTFEDIDPNANGTYFASSISYMMALAIHLKYDEIQLFGIDLLCSDEYSYQRPNLEYLIGVARGKGIQVIIPTSAALCKYSHLYGYENHPGFGVFVPADMARRLKEYSIKKEQAMMALYTVDGAIQEVEQLIKLAENFDRGLGHDKLGDFKREEE